MSKDVDLAIIFSELENYCKECDEQGSCNQSKCFIGFAKRTVDFSLKKGVLDIPGGSKLIPTGDLKPYYADRLIGGLAQTCKQCRDCRDNHSPDCVIALARTSLEQAILEENIDYPGSTFMYLALIKKQNPELAMMLAERIKG